MIPCHGQCGRTMMTIVVSMEDASDSLAAVVIVAASTSWLASAPWTRAIIPDIGSCDPKDEWANARHCYSRRMYNRLLHAVGCVASAAADDDDSYYNSDSRDFSISATRKTMMSGSVQTPRLRHRRPWPFVHCGCCCPQFVGSWMSDHGSLRRMRRTLALAVVAVKPMMRDVVVGNAAAAAVVVVVVPPSFGQRVVAIAAADMTSDPMMYFQGPRRPFHHHRKQLY
mmetsp:Transcript_13097/g.21333  ORF Transcript_13097/g.21333 Transcript_13097/m.21333 type:complete len:226 (-) Transcript_13097:209-886(-)